jgi:ribosomal protein S18 acetylase RimI-like enzyme
LEISQKNYPIYLAIEDEDVVAWCDIIPVNHEEMVHVGILDFGLLAEYRGKGIGTSLVKKCIDHAKKYNKIERVEVEVFESNRYAVELYKRMGFNIEGRKRNARKIDKEYDNVLIMGRILD